MLSGFALAQPLLDILGKNPEFFAIRRSSSSEIVLFALFLVFVPPAVLLAVELLVGLVNRSAMSAVHVVLVAAGVGQRTTSASMSWSLYAESANSGENAW